MSNNCLFFISSLFLMFNERFALRKPCQDLLSCSIEKRCLNVPFVADRIQDTEVTEKMYDDIDSAINYGCIFTSGCSRQCKTCTLCHNAKQRVLKVLSGSDPKTDNDHVLVECHELVQCAKTCITGKNISSTSQCLRHHCAYHCFNGSCPKCAAFILKIFNQMCITGDFRNKVKDFQGQCSDLFWEVVHKKFKKEFDLESHSTTN
ncbi:hypothetical protein DICVIV_02894 [Dictyocaulus viviparus]|uniref:Uncharacterized protein n=1 Tax=Dictyocaulus viviparus TaxID=29172 RepID=A0A0D8Y247_DICVI|nr:hypothetical protein DICVIV_02894 [Dictyocaulus viviparus]